MKQISLIIAIVLPLILAAQQPIIIDHTCIDLAQIPDDWIENAKENLWIGYGHTSHGTQLTQGMGALESYFTSGTYDWSHEGGPGELHLFEGGSSSGYLEGDCGTVGWDNETREYLDDFPDCSVIIWSWCGEVNEVDLPTQYFGPMEQLELDYPDVQFVYMTGHLEGLGPSGSVFLANQQIRDYCVANNKILYDFADIEKFSPDADTNFQEYYANDECDYNYPGGGTANWADYWLAANPGHELTQISQSCGYCSHSVRLNCSKKGIASWFLWARLAGWEGTAAIIEKKSPQFSNSMLIYPNPANHEINISFPESVFCNTLEIWDLRGKLLYSKMIHEKHNELKISNINIPAGVYVISIVSDEQVYIGKFRFYK